MKLGSFRLPGSQAKTLIKDQLSQGPLYENLQLDWWNSNVTEAFDEEGKFLGTVVFISGIPANEAIKGGLKK